jgi:Uncharacterized alpha/beta hydrolase domain (DUF2235)
MPRKLILCFDGTNDKYSADNTNVVKLYAMLERTQGDQLTCYQPGIGTLIPQGVFGRFQRWAVTFIDSAIAWLLQEHVTDGYRFLMRYYQPGDEIFIFGFSRGAYTARVVAGMLHKVGLLSAGNEELLPFAWDMYKRGRDRAISDGFRQTFSREARSSFWGCGIPSVRLAGHGTRSICHSRQTTRTSRSSAMPLPSMSAASTSCRIYGLTSPRMARTCSRSGSPVFTVTWAAGIWSLRPGSLRSH